MVETKVRHPRLYAILAGAVALVAMIALIGPRDGGPVGVDAASATSPDSPETTITSTPTSDDGVVLTAPGELVEVFEPPATSADVEVTSAAPATTTAPSVTSAPESATGSSSSGATTTTAAVTSTTVEDDEPVVGDTGEGDAAADDNAVAAGDTAAVDEVAAPASTLPSTTDLPASADDGTDLDGAAENTSVIAEQSAAGALLMAAPEMGGTANGTTVERPNLVGQIGTRDGSSVPWMLLIAANFGVTVSALVFLRLRR